MSFLEIFLIAGAVLLAHMSSVWLISLYLKNSSIVDPLWGATFVLAAVVYYLLAEGYEGRKNLVLLLVAVWGLRLSLYLLWRNAGHGEDFRYKRWREAEGSRWWWSSYFQVFILQGIILWIVSLPLLAAQQGHNPAHLTLIDALGVTLWGIGFVFEALGDFQLARFKANPTNAGRVMDRGLWRYTRHPNYFGDALIWWGFYLLAAAAGGWWTLLSPLLMTYLLMQVSGVALLEKTLQQTKPAYRDYVAKTSAFFPWPPKK